MVAASRTLSAREMTFLAIAFAVSFPLSVGSIIVATRGWGTPITATAVVVGILSLSVWLTSSGVLLAESS